MFHTHQMSLGEKRFFNDLDGRSYPYSLDNYKLKHFEVTTLIDAYKAKNMMKKRNYLINLYQYEKNEQI